MSALVVALIVPQAMEIDNVLVAGVLVAGAMAVATVDNQCVAMRRMLVRKARLKSRSTDNYSGLHTNCTQVASDVN